MSKITIIEPNSNDKDNIRNYIIKGERGYSAYDLYVQNGGTLTEEEWLDEFINADNFYNKGEADDLLDNKVNISDIVDDLVSTDTDKPLSANQGKELNDSKVNTSDIVDDLVSTDTDKPLSANQGKVLNSNKVNVTDIVDDLVSTDTDKPLSANQGKVLKDNFANYQPAVLSGTSNPDSSLGNNGDIYLQYS